MSVCVSVRARARVRALGASPARGGEAGALRAAPGARPGPAGAAEAAEGGGEDPAPGAARGGRHPGRRADPPGHSTLPPPPPLANVSGLQLPPSAPPSPLAPNANPATDERRPPPWLSPPADRSGSPGTRRQGSFIPRGLRRGSLGLPPLPTHSWFLSHLGFLAEGSRHLAACSRSSPFSFLRPGSPSVCPRMAP